MKHDYNYINNKNRTISKDNFFFFLQREYFIAQLRATIYPGKNDKVFWTRVALQKQETIKTLGIQRQQLHVFENKELYDKIRRQVIPEFGIPLFYYRNKEHEIQQSFNDYRFYFSRKAIVKYKHTDGSIVTSKIVEHNHIDQEVTIEYPKNNLITVSINYIGRVL